MDRLRMYTLAQRILGAALECVVLLLQSVFSGV